MLGRRDHEAYRKVFHATENACDKLRHAAERTWHYHANSCLQDDGPIVNVFEGTNPKTVADLRRLHSELLDLRRVASPSRAQIEQFDRKVAVYRAAFQSLGGDIPKDVRVALHAAASGGAPIHLFSSDVVAWLRETRLGRVVPSDREVRTLIGDRLEQVIRLLDNLERREAALLSWGITSGGFSQVELLDRVAAVCDDVEEAEDLLEDLEFAGLLVRSRGIGKRAMAYAICGDGPTSCTPATTLPEAPEDDRRVACRGASRCRFPLCRASPHVPASAP